jgi:hypothetical protein
MIFIHYITYNSIRNILYESWFFWSQQRTSWVTVWTMQDSVLAGTIKPRFESFTFANAAPLPWETEVINTIIDDERLPPIFGIIKKPTDELQTIQPLCSTCEFIVISGRWAKKFVLFDR